MCEHFILHIIDDHLKVYIYDADNNIKVFCLSRVRKNVENSHIFTIKRRSLTNQMHTKPGSER